MSIVEIKDVRNSSTYMIEKKLIIKIDLPK